MNLVLSNEQFTEIKNSLDSKYKDAAKNRVSKKLQARENIPTANKRRKAQPRLRQQKGGPSNRRQTEFKEILAGLSKLICCK